MWFSFFLIIRRPLGSTLFPYTTLFRSRVDGAPRRAARPPGRGRGEDHRADGARLAARAGRGDPGPRDHAPRSEEHTSELQSRRDLVCRLLLEKKKKTRLKRLNSRCIIY